jgi:hypothetical protein
MICEIISTFEKYTQQTHDKPINYHETLIEQRINSFITRNINTVDVSTLSIGLILNRIEKLDAGELEMCVEMKEAIESGFGDTKINFSNIKELIAVKFNEVNK